MYDGNIPLNVSVDYKVHKNSRVDADEINGCFQLANKTLAENREYINRVDSLFSMLNKLYDNGDYSEIKKVQEAITSLTGVSLSFDGDVSDSDYIEDDILINEIDAVLADSISWEGFTKEFGENYRNLKEYLKGCEFRNCEGITLQWLSEQGFESVDKTDNNKLYYCCTQDYYRLVDFENNLYLTVDLHENKELSVLSKAFGATKAVSVFNSWDENLKEVCDKIKSVTNSVVGAIDHLEQSLYSKNEKLGKELERVNKSIKIRENVGADVSRRLLRKRDKIAEQIAKNDKIAVSLA